MRGQQRGVAFHAVADEHGLHVRAQPRRKLRRPAQQLQCNRARSAAQNLGDYPDRSHFAALSHRPPGRAPAPRTVRILEHVSLFQVLHQPANRGFDRLVTRYDSLPVRLLGVNVADLGRRAFRAEQRGIVREVRGGQLLDWHGARGLQRVRAWERLRRDTLGYGEQRGQRAAQPFVALVRLPLDHDLARRLVQLQPPHAGNLRQPQHLGDLGADLARLGVHAVAPAQDEIERFAAQRQRERPRRGQRVGSCERPVDEVYGAVHAHGEALHQRVRGLRRAHGVDHRLDLGVPLQLGHRRHREHVERVDLVGHTLAHDATALVVEPQHRHDGHLLYANGDFHNSTLANSGLLYPGGRGSRLRRRRRG